MLLGAGSGLIDVNAGSLLYPSKMLYPAAVPLVSMFDTLYKDHHTGANYKKFRMFWIAFFA